VIRSSVSPGCDALDYGPEWGFPPCSGARFEFKIISPPRWLMD
jgi:hypothetical protein